jgi:NADH-quinone oxidoreductase subunit N
MNNPAFNVFELLHVLPELTILVGAMLLLMLGAFAKAGRAVKWVGGFSVMILATSLWLIMLGFISEPKEIFHGMLIVDQFSQVAKLILLVGAVMVLGLSNSWLRKHPSGAFEYPILVLLALAGMMVMVSANDLLTMYMGLELSALSLYVLAAFDRDNARSSEAGLKYFVLGALASGMMLFGASLVYGYTGSTNFSVIANLYADSEDMAVAVPYGAIIGMVLLTVGFGFKISAVPFHMWTPDVYEGSPTPVTMLFATAPKLAAMVVFIRILFVPFESMFPDWQNILAIMANASMLIGALGAMLQTNIKRLLAYGSIGHIGYVLVGVAAGTEQGIQAVLMYLVLYLFMSVGTFGFIMHMRRHGKYVEQISDLAGLSKTCPMAAAFMLVMMFSMAGIPPLAGFYGKMFVFLSAVEAGLIITTIVGLLTSVIAAYYYLKVVKVMYFDAPSEPLDRDVSLASQAILGLCALVTVGFFLLPSPLLWAVGYATEAIF